MKNNELELWIETDTLPRYGENTARLMTGAGRTSGRKASAQLRETEAQLEALCKAPDLAGTALEWLRDNRYVLRRDTAGCCRELRGARNLRKLGDGRLLILAGMEALVRSGGGHADETRLRAFLEGFQEVCPLEEKEVALLPAALRAALIGWLRAHPGSGERVRQPSSERCSSW